MIKYVRQALTLAFAAAVLAGCGTSGSVPSANAVLGPNPSSVLRSPSLIDPNSGPTIKKVSPIQAEQYQNIVIRGKGFGHMKPYSGDSCCIQFVITNPACLYYYPYNSDTWRAGYEGSGNEMGLNVTHWSNKKIVVTGFVGPYGSYCWYLVSNEPITLNIWNAQTQSGPATWTGMVH